MEEKKEDIFYVEVKEPEEVRRDILESLKDIIESLQRFEKFKDIRRDKLNHINKLGEIMRETNKLVSDLKTALPDAKIRTVKAISEITEKKKSSTRKKKTEEEETNVKPMTELQKLESELNDIEGKLQSLR